MGSKGPEGGWDNWCNLFSTNCDGPFTRFAFGDGTFAFGFYLPADDGLYVGFAPQTVQFMDKLADRSEQLSKQFAARSNNTRVHLLFLLDQHLPQTVGDLALQLGLPHANVSTT